MRLLLCALLTPFLLSAETPPPETQIAAAVLAAPSELRAGAAVLGYDAKGQLVLLREGKNDLICLASDPGKPGFSVACYQRELEPYMARGPRTGAGKSNRYETERHPLERSGRRQIGDAART